MCVYMIFYQIHERMNPLIASKEEGNQWIDKQNQPNRWNKWSKKHQTTCEWMSHISQFTSRFLATKCYKWIPHSPEEFSHLQFWGLYLPVTVESLIKTVAQQNQHMFDWQRGTILHLSNSACSRDCNAGVSNPCAAFPGSISIPERLKWANGKGFIIQNCHKTAQIAIHWELPLIILQGSSKGS